MIQVITPMLLSFLLVALNRLRLSRVFAVFACAGLGVVCAVQAFHVGEMSYVFGHTDPSLGIAFKLSKPALLFCSIMNVCAAIALWINETHGSITLALIASLSGLSFSNDLFNSYVFLELVTLSVCGTLASYGRPAFSYLIHAGIGSVLFLIGLLCVYHNTGHLNLDAIAKTATTTASLKFGVGLIMSGLFIKSGIFPASSWLVEVYGKIGGVRLALVSALVSKSYVLFLYKFIHALHLGSALCLYVGALSAVAASAAATKQTSWRGVLAHSCISHISCIFIALAINGKSVGAWHVLLLAHAMHCFAYVLLMEFGASGALRTWLLVINIAGLISAPVSLAFLGKASLLYEALTAGNEMVFGALVVVAGFSVLYGWKMLEPSLDAEVTHGSSKVTYMALALTALAVIFTGALMS